MQAQYEVQDDDPNINLQILSQSQLFIISFHFISQAPSIKSQNNLLVTLKLTLCCGSWLKGLLVVPEDPRSRWASSRVDKGYNNKVGGY